MTFEDIRTAINELDDQRISISFVQQLLNFVPTPEEIALLLPYKNTPNINLTKPDRFMLQMLNVERYETRLKAMMLRTHFDERIQEISSVMYHLQTITINYF